MGPAGQLLRAVLVRHGIDTDSVAYINSANCFPSVTKTPGKEHLSACRVHLAGQLAAVSPAHLLVVGITALTALIGDHVQLKQVRGRPFWLERLAPFAPFTRPIVGWPTYHPSAALRSSTYRMKLEDDVKAWVEWGDEGAVFPGECVKCGKEVETWDEYGYAWCSNHAGKQGVLI